MGDTIEAPVSLGESLFRSLQKYGTKILQFLDDTDEVNTYSDILIRSIRTAIRLRKQGVCRTDIISSCTHNQKHSWVPFLATQYLGAISANFDPNLPHLDTIHLLKLIQPKFLFVSEESLEFIEDCLRKTDIRTKLVVFGSSEKYSNFSEYIQPCEDENHFYPVQIEDEKDTAVILFSSGTTGLPKGICLHHKSFLKAANRDEFTYTLNKDSSSVSLIYSTLYWISAIFSLIKCISNGYAYVITRQFDPAYAWTLIEKYKVTMMFLAPYDAVDFMSHKPKDIDVSTVEIFFTGSSTVTKKLMESLVQALPRAKIINGYGLSETAGCTIVFDASDDEEYRLQLLKPTSCGKIEKSMKCKIVDINSEEILGPNREGEIRVKGECLMNGYYKMDSSSVFDSEGYLKTGDLAYYDEDNCFFIIGRIREMFKYRGWHIIPVIIEEVVISHPAVKEAAVVGIPHEEDGEHPMGIVALYEEYHHVTADEIETFVNARVSEKQKLRAGVRIVDYLPKTTTGKIKRRILQDIVINNILP